MHAYEVVLYAQAHIDVGCSMNCWRAYAKPCWKNPL